MNRDDQKRTPARKLLVDLYSKRKIIPARGPQLFKCQDYEICSQAAAKKCSKSSSKRLITGSWPYVGSEYGKARVNGVPMRILFVGMDVGGYNDKPTFATTQAAYRWATENRQEANAHMGGVHLIMRELVDDTDPATFSKQFALTNAVKCRRKSGNMRATTNPIIIDNCAKHLKVEIKKLRPNLIVTQGAHPGLTVRLFEPFANEGTRAIFSNGTSARPRKAEIFCADGRLLLTTPHPTRLAGLRWKRGKGELPNFLVRALRHIRRNIGQGTY